jgi:hypothetical protein
MKPSDDASDWGSLLRFVGYGRLSAPWWFIGLEEGTKDQTVENAIRMHASFGPETVVDLERAMRLAGFQTMPTNPTWRFVATIAAALHGTDDWRAYQNERMGRSDGETLLAEILPLPAPRLASWPDAYKGRWERRRDYRREVLPHRIRYLGAVIDEQRPALIIGYGKTYWPKYEQLTPDVDWRDERLDESSIRHGTFGATQIVLTFGPTSRQMNSTTERAILVDRIRELVLP